ncbi:BREX-2 system adenine-specific DNA-methyltransferase PglX [Micromonospora sp. NPDC005087]|uniref:BREX-2 system adenine-specific DNA-methyltransferase PglX n=1 Tax=Micromonospora sp. NPDC005087 TaxID=3364225 RepID=UPI0036A38F9A
MAVSTGLTAALKKVVLDLEDDLRDRVASQPEVLARWKQEHQGAEDRERTAMSWPEWRDDRVTQAAVAWVLTTVFVRFCEDNRLLKPVWIAGPADRRQEALDAELAYFRAHPEDTDREWVLQAVEYLRSTKATQDLVESHSPLWTVLPSGQAAKRLLAFWRERTADGDLIWDLTDGELSTRFLGDLYQDLSDYAKSAYALLQTPDFVEEFLLDQTMEPSLAERPLEGFKFLDPTCGSGHFLLGAFARLNDRWAAHAPGLEAQARVQKALDAIHGVDLNPFAVAIARFRLMVAALQAANLSSLENAPAFKFQVASGDSLLHGRSELTLDLPGMGDYDSGLSGFAYATEDLTILRSILEPGTYDVVVGNPPYITVKDKRLSAAYRDRYPTCKGTYALTVPFMERFFQLAKTSVGDRPAGWVGQITSNSFMKREFGSRLIEQFLTKQDLRLVVDLSGAYIPGHGTPTVVLVGRHQSAVGDSVKAVLGIRGEPGQPANPSKGMVWTAILNNIHKSEFHDSLYVTVTRLPRKTLSTHPWSLGGGGATAILTAVNKPPVKVGDRVRLIGRTCHTGSDDAYFAPVGTWSRHSVSKSHIKPLETGDVVRDWSLLQQTETLFPYDEDLKANLSDRALLKLLWNHRSRLSERREPGGTHAEIGLTWYEFSRWHPERFEIPLGIAMASVATHTHFVLDRGGKIFKQSAPVIKLPDGATLDDHLALVGVLNSSTACFWMKQISQGKGGADNNSGGGNRWFAETWERFYDFTPTGIQNFPLPSVLPTQLASSLDKAAHDAANLFASLTNSSHSVPSAEVVNSVHENLDKIRARMIAEQEELDWFVYRSFGLIDEDLTYEVDELPALQLGERAFEIALARKVLAGEDSTAWFTRHGSMAITEMPAEWPQAYRDLVQRRLDLIESHKSINFLERPEFKRRWSIEPWKKRLDRALRAWLLHRLEARSYWFDAQGRPVARSVAQLADVVSRDFDLVSVLQLWDGRKDRSVTQQLATLLESESVPFLAAYRLKDSGLRKREAWEHTWQLQRREDGGEKFETIPVPPKYSTTDFRKQSWWQHRGKLDVPKERFVLYPDAGRETDPTQLLGWAGWDHAQQALALNTVIAEREAEGWADYRLVPLVAGLAELQPWVRQWHDETDPTYQLNLADYLEEQLRGRAHQVGMTVAQLGAWKPPAAGRGRRPKS